KPAKRSRRPGSAQRRKLVRATTTSVAHEPPRRTRDCSPKCTAERSVCGNATNPGYGWKNEDVHSQTSPAICWQPHELARAANDPAGAGEKRPKPRFASVPAQPVPQG